MTASVPGGAATNGGGAQAAFVPHSAGGMAHNTYKTFVPADDDFIGHVAYALYKRDKLKFCEEELRRNGSPASSDSIDAFIRSSNIESRVKHYRSEAEGLLKTFTDIVLGEVIEVNRKEFREHLEASRDEFDERLQELIDHANDLSKSLAETKRSWAGVILEALVGSLAVAAMWVLLVAVLYGLNVGPGKMLRDVFNVDVTQSGVSGPPTPDTQRLKP